MDAGTRMDAGPVSGSSGSSGQLSNLFTNLFTNLFSGLFTILAGFCPEMLMRIFTNDAALVASGSQYLRAVALSYVLCGISQVYLILLKNTGHAAVLSLIHISEPTRPY